MIFVTGMGVMVAAAFLRDPLDLPPKACAAVAFVGACMMAASVLMKLWEVMP